MPRCVAEIASAAGREETELAAAGARREARLRDSELFVLVLALAVGVAAGLGVVLINLALGVVRNLAFGIPFGSHLSEIVDVAPPRLALMPIVGGLLVSQALTLYTTPVLYLYLDRFRLAMRRRWRRAFPGIAAAAEPAE